MGTPDMVATHKPAHCDAQYCTRALRPAHYSHPGGDQSEAVRMPMLPSSFNRSQSCTKHLAFERTAGVIAQRL
eukprot:569102-Alexandrium_andersonii.AAC.1